MVEKSAAGKSSAEQKRKNFWIWLVVGVVVFYGLPLLGKAVPADAGMMYSVVVLLLLGPAYSLVGSILLAWKNGFRWYLPIVVGVLFAPTLFIFYNASAWPYLLAYVFLSLMGDFSGHILAQKPSADDMPK